MARLTPSMSGDIAIKELDWYLRDHFFRQSNAGKAAFRRESLPGEMVSLYLRYRGADQQQLSEIMNPVIDAMVARKMLEQNGNELKLSGALTRLQCVKCFYINYLVEAEPRTCIKCQHTELRDFPPKKKA